MGIRINEQRNEISEFISFCPQIYRSPNSGRWSKRETVIEILRVFMANKGLAKKGISSRCSA